MEDNQIYGLCIELTSNCNYRCVGCPSMNLLRGRGNMEIGVFDKILREVGNDSIKISLWNYGDPLLHPNIETLLNISGDYSCQKVLSTTGWKLEDFEDLSFLGNLDELIISINGLTEEIYKTHQIGGNFQKVLRGLNRIREIPQNVKCTMQMVANTKNLGQISHAKDFAIGYGFDRVTVKTFNAFDNDPTTIEEFVPLGTEYSRYQDSSTPLRPLKINNALCLSGMVINWDGSVNPCCFDYTGSHVMGNVQTHGVKEIWGSEEFIKLRREISEERFLDICTVDCTSRRNVLKEDLK